MAKHRERKKRTSSGARKVRASKGISKRTAPVLLNTTTAKSVLQCIKMGLNSVHPDPNQLNKQWSLSTVRVPPNRQQQKKITPPNYGFPLMEQAVSEPHRWETIKALLIRSSLKIKPVRRWPGWILQRTYDLKNRPLDLSI